MWPKVSIIWLNHNSSRIMPIVLKSLESIINLDYPSDRFELIVVDNGSNDGSFERIREFLEKKHLRKRVIGLSKNLGFTGGNNIGFMVRDKESEYVVLVNNDCIVAEGSLKLYVETLETFPSFGAVQGTVLGLDSKTVDSVGIYLTDLLIPVNFPKNSSEVFSGKVFLCSAVEGTFPALRVKAILKAFNSQKIFDESFYGFGEDVFTSIQLWRAGFRIAFIAKPVGFHKRGATWSSLAAFTLSLRNYLAMTELFSGNLAWIVRAAIMLRRTLTCMPRTYGCVIKAIMESRKLAKKLFQKYGRLHLPKSIPLINIPRKKALIGIFIGRVLESHIKREVSMITEKFIIK